jgi:hypothetical protein
MLNVHILSGGELDDYTASELTEFDNLVPEFEKQFQKTYNDWTLFAFGLKLANGPIIEGVPHNDRPAILMGRIKTVSIPIRQGSMVKDAPDKFKKLADHYAWVVPDVIGHPDKFFIQSFHKQGDGRLLKSEQLRPKLPRSLANALQVTIFMTPQEVRAFQESIRGRYN